MKFAQQQTELDIFVLISLTFLLPWSYEYSCHSFLKSPVIIYSRTEFDVNRLWNRLEQPLLYFPKSCRFFYLRCVLSENNYIWKKNIFKQRFQPFVRSSKSFISEKLNILKMWKHKNDFCWQFLSLEAIFKNQKTLYSS